MPRYEVRRRTVLTVAVVDAANETEARFLARDAWQQDAALAALAADVTRQPFPPDDNGVDLLGPVQPLSASVQRPAANTPKRTRVRP